jgi:alanine racemase
MPRPVLAEIDLAALRHNLAVARRHAGGRWIWAVVKANAYGHGVERVLPALADAEGLALLDLDEAQRARDAGWRKPILLLEGLFEPADLEVVTALGLTPVIQCREQIDMLAARRSGTPLEVYVKLNTGMQRLGFGAAELQPALQGLHLIAGVRVTSLMTHFANGEGGGAENAADVEEQLRRFNAWTQSWSGQTCLANSAALLMQPKVKGDAVRPGILLYGGTPASAIPATEFDLKPVMRLRSKLIAVQPLAPGDAVGYGSRWVARRATRVGIVACGYADGYPRIAPDGTPVWVDGQIVPTAGRVSMDMIAVDLADAPGANIGSEVELWGTQVPIDTVAERAGTVGYELMCALAPRVPVRVLG